ncbi:MAG TPA: hypothetical protein VGE10_11185, partial [Zeimonas sp.]
MAFPVIVLGAGFLGAFAAVHAGVDGPLPGARAARAEAIADTAASEGTRTASGDHVPLRQAASGPSLSPAREGVRDSPRLPPGECPMLRLPWGPIASCTSALVAAGVATSALVSVAAWWNPGFDGRVSVAD